MIEAILLIILILLVLYVIYKLFSGRDQLTSIENGNKEQTIKASQLPNDNNSSNFTYSTWFYVQDWSYRFGEPKILLSRGNARKPCPRIVLGEMQNNIKISIACYGNKISGSEETGETVNFHCELSNFPIQKWVNLTIGLNGQTLDVYVNGKLTRTCVLPGPAIEASGDLFVTPRGGFNGYTANFQYWSEPVNPQQAYNIYKSGYGSSSLANMFGNYGVRVQFLDNGKVDYDFTM